MEYQKFWYKDTRFTFWSKNVMKHFFPPLNQMLNLTQIHSPKVSAHSFLPNISSMQLIYQPSQQWTENRKYNKPNLLSQIILSLWWDTGHRMYSKHWWHLKQVLENVMICRPLLSVPQPILKIKVQSIVIINAERKPILQNCSLEIALLMNRLNSSTVPPNISNTDWRFRSFSQQESALSFLKICFMNIITHSSTVLA